MTPETMEYDYINDDEIPAEQLFSTEKENVSTKGETEMKNKQNSDTLNDKYGKTAIEERLQSKKTIIR